MYAKWFFVLMLLFGVVSSERAYAIAGHSTTDPQEYIDLGLEFPSVGAFFNGTEEGNVSFAGSGVAVDKRAVLTAAHIFFDGEGNLKDVGTFKLGSNDFFNPVFEIDIVSVHPDPDFTLIGLSDDIAVVELAQDIPDEFIVPISDTIPQVGGLVYQSGHGPPGTQQGIGQLDGLRRAAINEVDQFGFESFGIPEDHVLTEFLPPNFSAGNPLGGISTLGDSGGGWFLENEFGEMELFAISGFEIGSPSYFSSSGALLIDPNMDFVAPTIAAISVPEPSAVVLFSLAGLTVINIRKRL